MSIREYLLKQLSTRGMFDSDAIAVLSRVEEDPNLREMTGRWEDEQTDYPPGMMAVLWMYVKQYVLQWIDEEKPKAWFRPLFAEEPKAKVEAQ